MFNNQMKWIAVPLAATALTLGLTACGQSTNVPPATTINFGDKPLAVNVTTKVVDDTPPAEVCNPKKVISTKLWQQVTDGQAKYVLTGTSDLTGSNDPDSAGWDITTPDGTKSQSPTGASLPVGTVIVCNKQR